MEKAGQKQRYPPPEVILSDESSGFDIVRYPNGSHSLKDPATHQVMHSMIGAQQEAMDLYALPSGINDKLSQRDIVLWDVGMGTAANVTAVLDILKVSHHTLIIHSFENDLRGLSMMLQHPQFFQFLNPYSQILNHLLTSKRLSFKQGETKIDWHLHEGDFFSVFNNASKPDVIFYDFYAPAVVPQLWSVKGFQSLREFINTNSCTIHTYAAATPVRLNMLLAGFYVGYGPRTAMKHDTTVAATSLEMLEQPLGEAWKQKLMLSTSVKDEADRSRGLLHPQFSSQPSTH